MKKFLYLLLFIFGLCTLPAFSQTSANGRVGEGPLANRPSSCSSGDMWVRTDSPYHLYICGGTNTWTDTASLSTPGGSSTTFQYNNSGAFGGITDLTYTSGSTTITGLSGLTFDLSAVTAFKAPGMTFTTSSNTIAGLSGETIDLSSVSAVKLPVTNAGRIYFVGSSGQVTSSGGLLFDSVNQWLDATAVACIITTTTPCPTTANSQAFTALAESLSTSALTQLVGFSSSVQNASSGTIGTGIAYLASGNDSGGNSGIGTSFGFDSADQCQQPAMTLCAALYIAAQSNSGYGIYENGAGLNKFSDVSAFAKNINLTEISDPMGISSTSVIWAKSSNHWLEFNPNATGALRVIGGSGTFTSGHCLELNDTVGTVIDAGGPCGTGSTGTVTSVAESFTGGLISVGGSPITTSGTLTLTVAGTSGGVPYFSSGTTWASSAALTANLPVIGGGAGTAPTVGTVSGNTTEFATISGALTNGHGIKVDASGNLVDTGSAPSAATVTSVAESFTGGLISVGGTPITTSGTLALTVAGTSGGIPYFSGATTWASSGALTVNLPVIGGGAGSAPTVGTRSGNTTKFVTTTGTLTNGDCVSIDASGNFIDSGQVGCGGGGAGGTVTSVALATPTGLTVSGSPVVTSGTLTFAMPTGWTTGSILLGNGSNSVATLLIGGANTVLGSNGTTASWVIAGTGTVTSVGVNTITTASQNFALCPTANSGTTPVTTCTLQNVPAHTVFGNVTAGSAAPDYVLLTEAMLPAATVFTDQNATFGAHNYSFAGSTILKPPAAAGFAATANDFGLNTTSNNWQFWANGANKIAAMFASTPTNGQCITTTVSGTNVLLTPGSCVSGITFDTNSVANTTQTLLNFTNTAGASGINFTNPSGGVESATLASVAGGGNATLQCTITGPQSGDFLNFNNSNICVNQTPGITVNAQTTTPYTFLTGDRGKYVTETDASASAFTLPQSGSAGFASNWYVNDINLGTANQTITPTTSTINAGYNGTSALILTPGEHATIVGDNINYKASVSGMPIEVGVDSQVSQAAAISAKTLYATPSINGADGYLFHFYGAVDCTTTSAAATVSVSLKFTDISNTVQTIASSTATCTALGSSSLNALDYTFQAAAGTNIQYLTSIVNTPTYDVRVAVEQLGVF